MTDGGSHAAPALYLADRVLAGEGLAPLTRGGVLVAGGVIAAVDDGAALGRRHPGAALRRLPPGTVLLPGLVDAHTHLAFADLALRLPAGPFPGWIEAMATRVRETPPARLEAAARRGVRDALARGVTAVGDSGPSPAVLRLLLGSGLQGAFHLEVFGPDPAAAPAALALLEAQLGPLLDEPLPPGARPGVAPHAPYTVSPELHRALLAWARARGLPITTHLAESREEDAFVRDGAGPLAERLRRRGIATPARGCSPVAWLDEAGLLATDPPALLAHLTQASAADLERVARAGAGVALCPTSNAALGHGRPPLAALLASGVRLGLGSDSAASNPRRDLFEEMRALLLQARVEGAPLDAARALRLVTCEGARLLGGGDRYGALLPGRRADLIALGLGDLLEPDLDPTEAVVWGGARERVLLTLLGGRVAHAAPGLFDDRSPPEEDSP